MLLKLENSITHIWWSYNDSKSQENSDIWLFRKSIELYSRKVINFVHTLQTRKDINFVHALK